MSHAGLLALVVDLIGERLAFQRSAVRLYEALAAKAAAVTPTTGAPTAQALSALADEKLGHVGTLVVALEELGGDPVRPSSALAAATAATTNGALRVVTDPHATLTQALFATLGAELLDNEAWTLLGDLAERLGYEHQGLAGSFRQALVDEERHLDRLRTWLTAGLEAQAGLTRRRVPHEAHAQP